MTVRELIEQLKEIPQDLPVVTDYHEIVDILVDDSYYFIDKNSKDGYFIGSALVLE